ncbi:hypothetical protein BOX15_Mlig015984g1, partial [Macrostomum lignano]
FRATFIIHTKVMQPLKFNKVYHQLMQQLFPWQQHYARQLATACSSSSSNSSTFRFADLETELTKEPQTRPSSVDSLVFGTQFSDHMLVARHTGPTGWSRPRIEPIRCLPLHPATKALHYALECFEGLKAYWGVDGRVRLFRPLENMKRLRASAERATLASFDPGELLDCLRQLVRTDLAWVPRSQEGALYIRPAMIASEPRIAIGPAEETTLFIITGPVGPYYPTGFKPVTLLADPEFARAWPGGAGRSKMGSNYGPTCRIQLLAAEQGCQQVLWLFGPEHRITEVGTMNVFLFWRCPSSGRPQLVTPALTEDLILPGITRSSVLELARQWGDWEVIERNVTMPEVADAIQSGRLLEMFGCGTACVVNPVGAIRYQGQLLQVPTMSEGAPVTMRFFKALTDIQYGRIPQHPWADIVA